MYSIAEPIATDSLASSQPKLKANFSILQTMLGASSVASEHRIAFVGEIKMWGGASTSIATSIPGWLHCDGAAVSRTTYADLYGIISTFYGVGDGSTTFNLPSLTSVFVRGANTTPGGTGGADSAAIPSHTLTTTEMPAHTHDTDTGSTGVTNGAYNYVTSSTPDYVSVTSGSAGSGGAHGHSTVDTIPKYGSVIYVIKI